MSALAILILMLSDGSIVEQYVDIDAYICFKVIGKPVTRCLVQGEEIWQDGVYKGRELVLKEFNLEELT